MFTHSLSRPRNLVRHGAVICERLEERTLLAGVPTPDHVLVVVEENRSYSGIIGYSGAPYINSLASQGALFTNSFGVTHPSQPNYLALFSGSTQGVTDDNVPPTFSAANLGSELLGAGKSFVGYSESLPSVGFTGANSGSYWRKHAPWVDFSNIPTGLNQPFTSFPSDFSQLPTLSFVIPNQANDMHDGSRAQGDTWLHDHIDPYVQWAKTHNSLLVLTWDEDDFGGNNHITTIFAGAMVKTGQYAERIDHYNVLRTLEDMYALPAAGQSASASPITDVWNATVAPDITITQQPADRTVDPGQSASFSVAAQSALPLSYQWLRNGTAISGAVGSSFSISAAAAGDNAATFSVRVSNASVSVNSRAATLTVTQPVSNAITITSQPADLLVQEGQQAKFTVVAQSALPLSYQWLRNGTVIGGATSASYTIPSATHAADDGTQFSVRVSNSSRTVTSNAAHLLVPPPPVSDAITINEQPVDRTVQEGESVGFAVTAQSLLPTSFQWFRNGNKISGATSAIYTIAATRAADSGAKFTVKVSNATNSVTSTAATLTVTPIPVSDAITITRQPASLSVQEGRAAAFTVTAQSALPLTYQWLLAGQAIAGATASTYTIPATTVGDNGAQLSVIVSNASKSVTSAAATLSVTPVPVSDAITVSRQPANLTVDDGQPATFSVAARSALPLTYQWLLAGQPISGATASDYTIPATSAANNDAQLSVVISNASSSATSRTATLTVRPPAPSTHPITITTQPADQTVQSGQPVTFVVGATSDLPLTYQWTRNGVAIEGGTSTALALSATSDSDNGATFALRISNASTTVATRNAVLTVTPVPISSDINITRQPSSQSIEVGAGAVFSVEAQSARLLTYQWFRDGVAIPGATAAGIALPPVSLADSGAAFTVVIANDATSKTSDPATLTVTSTPVPTDGTIAIVAEPADQTVPAGEPVTFTVQALSALPLRYQWLRAGAPIDGATEATFTIPATSETDGGATFSVRISNDATTLDSRAAALSVQHPPTTTPGPTPVIVTRGDPFRGKAVKLSGSATDAAGRVLVNPAYTWTVKLNAAGQELPVSAVSRGIKKGTFRPLRNQPVVPGDFYSVSLAVTDSQGHVGTSQTVIPVPVKTLSVTSNVPGISFLFDGASVATPASIQVAVGSRHTLEALDTQTVDQTDYDFTRWSRGRKNIIVVAVKKKDLSFSVFYNIAP